MNLFKSSSIQIKLTFIIGLLLCLTSIDVGATPMTGTYTVGSDAGDDFATVTESIDSLTLLGVTGPVIIQLDSSTFNEQIEIGVVTGVSATNTITFKGFGSKTVISYAPTSANRTVISFNGASHIVFDSLKVEATGSTYGIGFLYYNESDSITIRNCYVKLPSTSSTYNSTGFANYSTKSGTGTSTVKSLLIENDSIESGYEGIRLIGNSSIVNKLEIRNNVILEFGFIGVHISGTVEATVESNEITSAQNGARCAVSMWPTGHTIQIIANRVHLSSNVNHTRVFQIANAPGGGGSSMSQAVLVANNMVIYDGNYSNNMTGIYTKHVNYMRIYNNSVYMDQGTSPKSIWLDALSATGSIEVVNNIMTSNVTNGQLLRKHNLVSATSNFNNYYSTSSFQIIWGGTHTSLAAFNTSTSQGANSVSIDPEFISTSDLHVDTTNYLFKGLGSFVSQVTTDIDGDTRSTVKPDIGADEFNSNIDLELGEVTSPENCRKANPTVAIRVWIKNLSSFSVSQIPVNYTINGGTVVNEVYSGSIPSNDSVLYTFLQRGYFLIPGQYEVKTYLNMGADENLNNDTSTLSIGITNLASNLKDSIGACYGESVVLDPGTNNGAIFLWSNGATSNTISLDTNSSGAGASWHWVQITDAVGCVVSDTVKVIFSSPATFSLPNDTTLCTGDSLTLDASFSNATYSWQDGSNGSAFLVDTSGVYTVEVETGYECISIDSSIVAYSNLPQIDLGDQLAFCSNDSLEISVVDTFMSYQWQDGSSNNTYYAKDTGLYWLAATDSIGCVGRDSVNIKELDIPIMDLGEDTSICDRSSVILDATTVGCTYLWHNNSMQATFSAETEGWYKVDVTNSSNCSISDSIYVSILDLPNVVLGRDTSFCEGTMLTLDVMQEGAEYVWQDGSNAPQLAVSEAGLYWVELADSNGCLGADSINLTRLAHTPIVLPKDTSLGYSKIQVTSYVLDAGNGYSDYLWSNNGTTSKLEIDENYGIGNHSVWVRVKSSNNCTSRDTIEIEVYDDANVDEAELDFKIYPNPAKDVVHINGINGQISSISITTMEGKILTPEVVISNDMTEVFIQDLAPGFYIIRFEVDSVVGRSVFVKAK